MQDNARVVIYVDSASVDGVVDAVERLISLTDGADIVLDWGLPGAD